MSHDVSVAFTAHAEQRIAERELDRAQVMAVARAPEQIVAEEGRLPVAQSRLPFMGRPALLRVVFYDEGGVRVIITAYFTFQIKRYWREE